MGWRQYEERRTRRTNNIRHHCYWRPWYQMSVLLLDQNSDLDHYRDPSCSLFRMPWSRMPKYSSMDNCLTDRNNSKRVTVIQDLSQFKFLIKMKFLPARHLCYFWPKFLRMEYWANLHTLWRWCNQQPSSLSKKIKLFDINTWAISYDRRWYTFINSYHITFVTNKEFVDWFGCISVDFLQPLFYIIEWILIYKNRIKHSFDKNGRISPPWKVTVELMLAIYRAKIARVRRQGEVARF